MPRRPSKGPVAVVTEPPHSAADCNAVEDLANLLTPTEVSERFKIDERLLTRWRSTGNGPKYLRLSRKTIRYRRSDLYAFVFSNIRSNTAQ